MIKALSTSIVCIILASSACSKGESADRSPSASIGAATAGGTEPDTSTGATQGVGSDSNLGGTSPVGGSEAAGGQLGLGGETMGGASGSGGDESEEIDDNQAPVVSGFLIESNANSEISCIVSWTSDVPADSEVLFGIGDVEFRIRHEEKVTDHRVVVVGMYADSSYVIRAQSTNSLGSDSDEGSFDTGSLPETVPVPTLTVSEAASQEGWTLISVQPASERGLQADRPPGVMLMVDELGKPVWYYENGELADEFGDVSIQYLPGDHVMLGPTSLDAPKEINLEGEVIWLGPSQSEDVDGQMTHFAGKLKNGNYVLLKYAIGPDDHEGAIVEEVTPNHEVVWSWHLFDYLEPELLDSTDWCHPNAVTIDEENEFLYLSCRWLGVIKGSYGDDPALVWILGEALDDGSFAFEPVDGGFADQHDPEFHDDGTVLIYDNGGYTFFPMGDEHSRVLEYSLDETEMVATLEWSFPGDFQVDAWYQDEWYTPFWGDADRLENGNVLISAGMRDPDIEGRIFEVSRDDGQVVWEITLPVNVGCYQSERIKAPVERL